jgi:hypothetical protein
MAHTFQVCNAQGECESAAGTITQQPPPMSGIVVDPQPPGTSEVPAVGIFSYSAWSECVVDCSNSDKKVGPISGTQSRTVECIGTCAKDEAEALFRPCLDTPCFDRACKGDPCGKGNTCSVVEVQGEVRIELSMATSANSRCCQADTSSTKLHCCVLKPQP